MNYPRIGVEQTSDTKPNDTEQEHAYARARILEHAEAVLAGEDGDVTSEAHLANYHAALQLAVAIKIYLEAEQASESR